MFEKKYYATGVAELINLVTPSPKFQNYWIKFKGTDDVSREEIDANMSSWHRPIPVYRPNEADPVDAKPYEGMEVKCTVQYSSRKYNGQTYYDVYAILVDSTEEPVLQNPFECFDSLDVSDFAGEPEPSEEEPKSPIRSLDEI